MDVQGFKFDKTLWETTILGELAQEVSTRIDNPSASKFEKFVGLEHFVSGELKINNFGSTDNLTSSMKEFQSGDILFARRNAYLRRASLVDFDGVCSGDAFVLKENHEKVAPGLLAFIVNSNGLWDFANANAAGGMSKRVKWRDLASYEFLLPPKSLQSDIAELLWAIDELIQDYSSIHQKCKILIQSTFKERCAQSTQRKKCRVKDLLIDGPRNGYSPKASTNGEGSRTVSISAVKNGLFTPEGNIKYAEVDNDILTKFNILSGDVFVVRGNGNKVLCGLAGLAKKEYSNLFYPDLLMRLRFSPKKIIPEFATFMWNSPTAHKGLLRWAKSTNGIWKVNGDDIKRHTLEIPPPDEQGEIMEELNSIELRIQQAHTALSVAKKLQRSLINQVF